jgi:hypothetical protein
MESLVYSRELEWMRVDETIEKRLSRMAMQAIKAKNDRTITVADWMQIERF